jgi:cytidylate kinase
MATSVVCLSRTLAAGGEEIGRQVAARLGFRYVDEEIVLKAAEKENVDAQTVADAERRQTLIERLLEGIAATPLDPIESGLIHPAAIATGLELTTPLPAQGREHYRELIRTVIHETAAQGNVVIVAHGAAMALAGTPGLLRVLVTASTESRTQRLVATGEMDNEKARKEVKRSDANRRDFFKRFYSVTEERPTHYDLVINTDVLSQQQAASAIVAAAEQSESK